MRQFAGDIIGITRLLWTSISGQPPITGASGQFLQTLESQFGIPFAARGSQTRLCDGSLLRAAGIANSNNAGCDESSTWNSCAGRRAGTIACASILCIRGQTARCRRGSIALHSQMSNDLSQYVVVSGWSTSYLSPGDRRSRGGWYDPILSDLHGAGDVDGAPLVHAAWPARWTSAAVAREPACRASDAFIACVGWMVESGRKAPAGSGLSQRST